MALHAFSSTLASRSTTTTLTGSAGRKSLAVSSAGQQASASKFQQHHGDKGGTGYNNMSNMHSQFRSSSSQTTFLDRNIVQNLAVTSSSQAGGGPFDQQPQSSSSKLSSVGGRTTATVATGAGGHAARRRRPKTVPASYTSGSGSVKRASFSGTLPDGKQNC